MSILSIYNKVCSRTAIVVLLAVAFLTTGVEAQTQKILTKQQVEKLRKAGKLPGKPTNAAPPKKTDRPTKTQSSTTVEGITTTINAQTQQDSSVEAVEMPAIGAVNVDSEEVKKRKDELQIKLGGTYKDLEFKTRELEGLTRGEDQPLSEYLTKKREVESEIAAINLQCTQIQLQIEELGR